MISLTLWPSLYDTTNPAARSFENLSELEEFFSTFVTTDRKDSAPGFGPYTLRPGGTRRDPDVLGITCGVFDVDTFQGNPPAEMGTTLRRLIEERVDYLWYSTFSNSEEKPSFRLVVPFAKPIAPEQWPQVRAHMLSTFQISADPKKCSGASHFYYLPSLRPGGTRSFTAWRGGQYYQPPEFPPLSRQGRPLYSGSSASLVVRATEPTDLAPLRATLEKRANNLCRAQSPDRKKKGQLLWLLLLGDSLGKHGERNHNTFITAGVVGWALPVGTPIDAMLELFRQSYEAMQADGSSLTWDEVERALTTAAEKHAIAEDSDNKLKAALDRLREQYNPAAKP